MEAKQIMSTIHHDKPRLLVVFLFSLLLAAPGIAQDVSVEVIPLSEWQRAAGQYAMPGMAEPHYGLTVQDLRVHQLHLLNMVPQIFNSIEGILIFLYSSAVPLYFTIGAERPGFGFTFVAQNLYLATALTLAVVAIRFNLQALGINPGNPWPPTQQLQVYVHYGSEPSPAPPPAFIAFQVPVTPEIDDASNGYDAPVGMEPPIDDPPPQPNLNSPITVSHHYGCTVPNIDLDSLRNAPGSGYAGDKNACGPAAASNSMMWLAQTYPGITIPFSHRALLDSLSRYMARQPNSGVSIENFIRGKLDFIRAHNLPIQVKFQAQGVAGNITDSQGQSFARNDNSGTYPTWAFLKQEMADSEDVELFYQWFDGTAVRGHVVTVTGAYETASGKRYIGMKHDIKQRDSGGTVQEFPEITVDQHGRMILHRHGRRRYISHIVSESPGPPFTTDVGEDQRLPETFRLAQNYPNPFNPSTTIRFWLSEKQRTRLAVYDVLGREVALLVDDELPAGSHASQFNTADLNLPSGVYYYRLTSGRYADTKPMVLLK
jgi:hypothetical protein